MRGKVTSSNNNGRKSESEFSGKILSVSFTLLGLLIGFYGIISSAVGEAGPWKSLRGELLPFLFFLWAAITLNCLLGILAVLCVAGYLRARVALTVLSCTLLAFIGTFITVRSLQLWLP
jgi:hypothetical protein